ncbi:cytochrome P450 [Setomelanomma holmii]|uniref:Cytochrome P450 n=1 Tax=Setomelanomma holmii TaxID=210430 RepID=A0A9P4LJM9_9PLEO|nr:cytochrome P450 [Setomelanomma holmii]
MALYMRLPVPNVGLSHGQLYAGAFFAIVTWVVTNTFLEPNIAAHTTMRRPFAALYSNTQLLSYEPFVDTCNSILLKRLREYATDAKELDVRELVQFCAFGVIGEITVGSRFGLKEDGGDKFGITSTIDSADIHGAHVGLVPELHCLLGCVVNCFKIRPSVFAVVDFVNPRIEDRVNERTKSPDDRQDLIDKMLPLKQSGKALRRHTHMACQQNVGAGSDTTAISLAATIRYLAMYPNTLAKLRQELEKSSARGELSEPVTFKEAQKLPYLQAVIQEALRMHPAVGAPLTRIVSSPGLNRAEQFLLAGTEFGRWLTSDPQERARLERNFLTFGAGPRVCIGKNMYTGDEQGGTKDCEEVRFRDDEDGTTGKVYDWKTYCFTKQDFKCIVRERKVRRRSPMVSTVLSDQSTL